MIDISSTDLAFAQLLGVGKRDDVVSAPDALADDGQTPVKKFSRLHYTTLRFVQRTMPPIGLRL